MIILTLVMKRELFSGSDLLSRAFMLFTDANNTTYRVDAPFTPADAYSAGQGQVMKLDTKSGHLTPVVVSIGNSAALQDPHGVLFILQ
jgi:hypothetical protein